MLRKETHGGRTKHVLPHSKLAHPPPTTTDDDKNTTVQIKWPSGENTHPQRTKRRCLHKRGYPAITVAERSPHSARPARVGWEDARKGVREEVRSIQLWQTCAKQREATRAAGSVNIAKEPRVCKEIHTQGPASPPKGKAMNINSWAHTTCKCTTHERPRGYEKI